MGSSGNTPDIRVRFGAEGTDAVVAAIRSLTTSLDNLKKRQDENAKSTFSMRDAFTGLVNLAVAEKLLSWEKATLAQVFAVGKLQQVSGMSAQTLSVLAFAANRTGIETDGLTKMIAKGARSITDFQSGGTKAAQAFSVLGIKQRDFANLSPDQKFLKVAGSIATMHNGFQKAAIVQDIFGRGAANTLPLLNKLSTEGFQELTEKAQRLGQVFDQDAIDSAKRAKASYFDLRDAAKGAAIQFNNGLLPALADAGDALMNATSDSKVSGFKKIGEYAGIAAKAVMLAFIAVGKFLGTVIASIVEEFSTAWDEIKLGASTVWDAMGEAIQGNFAKAGQILKQGYKSFSGIEEDYRARQKAIWSNFGAEMKKTWGDLFSKTPKARTNDGGEHGEPTPADDSATKARLAAMRSALEGELALYKANAAQKAEQDKIDYDRGLLGLQQYFDRRRATLQAERDKEIATLQAEASLVEMDPTKTDAEAIAKKQNLAEIENKISKLRIETGTKEKALDQELFQAKEAAQKRVLDYQNQILDVQGRTFDAAIAKIQQESEEIRRALAQAGLSPQQVASLLSQVNAAKTLSAQWSDEQKQSSLEMGALGLDRQRVENDVASGKLLEIERDRELARVESERVANLRELATHMKEIAKQTGDPAKIQEAEGFGQDVESIAIAADYAHQQWTKFENGVISSIQGDLTNFLESGIDKVQGWGDAFRQLGLMGVNAIRKIASEMLVQMLMEKAVKTIKGWFGGGSDDDGGKKVATAAQAGMAQAIPLMVAGSMMSTAGAIISSAAITLGVSAGELMSAAMMLEMANSSGGGGFFADGGLVVGAGSATSDSIPARLSNGEFVVRAAAVQQVGVAALAAINRGIRPGSIASAGSIPRFADGGLVQAGGRRDAMDLRLGIGLDSGLILQHLSSKAAGKVIVQQLGDNSKSASKALSRG